MEKTIPKSRVRGSSKYTPPLVIFVTLVVFAAAIYLETMFLRQKIRNQMASRDAEILHAVATMELAEESSIGAREAGANPADQLGAILKTSRLKGVIATRLFDAGGGFVTALPASVTEAHLATSDLERLIKLQPISRFLPEANLDDLFLEMTDDSADAKKGVPLLQVEIPLHLHDQPKLLGIAQFFLDGQSIALDFGALDSNLVRQASTAFGAGSFIIILALAWAFRRLQKTNRLLSERTRSLLHVNQELSLAAKTSAVGAVTAHLLHGLSNPLCGLQLFVSSRNRGLQGDVDEDWRVAAALTQRMQAMIQEVVNVLRDDQGSYEISWSELLEIIAAKSDPIAVAAGVRFAARGDVDGVLSNREANLVIMILSNLIQNAIQATPKGKGVRLVLGPGRNPVVCEVQDEGPGLPDEMRANLFVPCHSSKANGNGIGLAICKQLANHIGAELVLKSSTPSGSVFALILTGM